jgi:eukaryotic-like serine/threonine-protein kinase
MSAEDGAADIGRISTVRVSPGSTGSSPGSEDWSGRVLGGRFELLREIGRGGMGIVYEARHVTLRRAVAVKVLRPEFARSEDALVRFEREARAAAAIGSPHIAEVIDFGRESSGEAWMVMELLDGEDLRARLKRGAMPEGEVRDLLRDVAAALRDAHAKGIVHRDLKSENVILVRRDGRARAKVVDFGISKVAADPAVSTMTARDVLLGTPHYMAPETADPDITPDHRVDLYALGCIAFEALTGALPFSGRTAVEVLYQHAHAPVPAPSARVRVSPELDRLVRRLLAKRPDQRFPDAAALLAALDAAPASARWPRVALAAFALLAVGLGVARARAPVAASAPPDLAHVLPPPVVRSTPAPAVIVADVAVASRDAGAFDAEASAPQELRATPGRRRRVASSPARDGGLPALPAVDGLRPSPY